jgi:outer membrane receptor protein involved in Fe transport
MLSYQRVTVMLAAISMALPVTGWSQIEEVVVTTRKKEEKLQEVPIAVSAITAEQIEQQGIGDLADVVRLSPSVQFDRSFGPSDTRVTIRGLSNQRGRSNVAFLVDGIDVTTENLVSAGSGLLANRRLLTDVQRVELVKGPQSALYGRAAFAGAISYTTKDPSEEWEGKTGFDLAEDGLYQVDAAFGGPLTDTIGTRLTGFYYNQDGHYVNSLSGDDVGGSSGRGVAWTAVYRPNDDTKIKFRTEYSKEDYDPLPNVRIGGGWQDGSTIALAPYPDGVIEHAQNQLTVPSPDNRLNGLGFSRNTNSTGLLDFGQYCPEGFSNGGNSAPGICLPRSYGSASGRVVAHGEDPLTNEDFDGNDLETFRASLVATFNVANGTITSYTGWTDFEGRDQFDQDWQADPNYTYRWGSPTIPKLPTLPNGRQPDRLLSGQIARSETLTDQFSQELRFASQLDGPLNFTGGALWWSEDRKLLDQNTIVSCLPIRKNGIWQSTTQLPSFGYAANLCDGGPYSGSSIYGPPLGSGISPRLTTIGWQEMYRQVQPAPATSWIADTQHWSFYATLDWQIADEWKLTLEERWVSETFELTKPNQTSCTLLASALTTGSFFPQEVAGDPFNAVCPPEELLYPDPNKNDGQINGADNWRYASGDTTSHFNTPKVTLEWKPMADRLVYFSWARGQKPGGINQLAAGGTPVLIDNERFLPEKLESWELGTKNTFEFLGALQLNASGFYQDYSDKQVSTQIIVDGVAQPRVLNASAAEVWGLELELLWQPDAVEGLLVGLNYTYLDAEYGNFIDDVTSVQRLAAINRPCDVVYRNGRNEVVAFDPALQDPTATPDPLDRITAVSCRVNLEGKKLERTPENAFLGTLNYTRPLLDNGVDLLVQADFQYQDSRFLDQDNGLKFDDYWLANFRLGLTTPKWELIGYVDNVFDDDTIKSGGSGPDFGRQASELGFTAGLGTSHYFGTLPDPRIVGVRMNYRFGAGY